MQINLPRIRSKPFWVCSLVLLLLAGIYGFRVLRSDSGRVELTKQEALVLYSNFVNYQQSVRDLYRIYGLTSETHMLDPLQGAFIPLVPEVLEVELEELDVIEETP